MEVVWDQIEFDDSLLDKLPEEAIARLTTHTKSIKRDSMQRHGIGILLNSMFKETAKGEQMYHSQIKQLSNACSETIAFGVIYRYLSHSQYVDPNEKYRTDSGPNSIDALVRADLDRWCCLVKDEDAVETLIDNLNITFSNRGVDPGDYFIWPMGSKKYHRGKDFYLSGKVQSSEPSIYSQAPGIKHRESRGFRVGNHCANEDPQFRQKTIGGFNVMNNLNLTDVPNCHYRTSMLDRIIYSEDEDGWVRMEYRKSARYTGLYYWGEGYDDCPLAPIGEDFFSLYESQTWGEYYKRVGEFDKMVEKLHKDLNDCGGCEANDGAAFEYFKHVFKMNDKYLEDIQQTLNREKVDNRPREEKDGTYDSKTQRDQRGFDKKGFNRNQNRNEDELNPFNVDEDNINNNSRNNNRVITESSNNNRNNNNRNNNSTNNSIVDGDNIKASSKGNSDISDDVILVRTPTNYSRVDAFTFNGIHPSVINSWNILSDLKQADALKTYNDTDAWPSVLGLMSLNGPVLFSLNQKDSTNAVSRLNNVTMGMLQSKNRRTISKVEGTTWVDDNSKIFDALDEKSVSQMLRLDFCLTLSVLYFKIKQAAGGLINTEQLLRAYVPLYGGSHPASLYSTRTTVYDKTSYLADLKAFKALPSLYTAAGGVIGLIQLVLDFIEFEKVDTTQANAIIQNINTLENGYMVGGRMRFSTHARKEVVKLSQNRNYFTTEEAKKFITRMNASYEAAAFTTKVSELYHDIVYAKKAHEQVEKEEASNPFTFMSYQFEELHQLWLLQQDSITRSKGHNIGVLNGITTEDNLVAYVLNIAFYLRTVKQSIGFSSETKLKEIGNIQKGIFLCTEKDYPNANTALDIESFDILATFKEQSGNNDIVSDGDDEDEINMLDAYIWRTRLQRDQKNYLSVWRQRAEQYENKQKQRETADDNAYNEERVDIESDLRDEINKLKKKNKGFTEGNGNTNEQKEKISRPLLEWLLCNEPERFGVHSARFWKYQINTDGLQAIGFLLLRPNQTYTVVNKRKKQKLNNIHTHTLMAFFVVVCHFYYFVGNRVRNFEKHVSVCNMFYIQFL